MYKALYNTWKLKIIIIIIYSKGQPMLNQYYLEVRKTMIHCSKLCKKIDFKRPLESKCRFAYKMSKSEKKVRMKQTFYQNI